MTTNWERLGLAVIASPDIPEARKPLAIAIAIGESGRGVTWVATHLLNFWSLKQRDGFGTAGIWAPDGYLYMCFLSFAQAVRVFWLRIHLSPYYDGIDEYLKRGDREGLDFFGPHFCPPGYEGSPTHTQWSRDHGFATYTDYILSFIPEAIEFLQRLGWKGQPAIIIAPPPAPAPLPAPQPIPSSKFSIVRKPAVGIFPDQIGSFPGGDWVDGTAWNPVRNFDRIRLAPAAIILHFTAALSDGVMDGWKNRISFRSAHFFIRRDGKIYQCVPLNFWSWAADGWNPTSINIELENFGCFLEGERKLTSWHDQKAGLFFRTFWPGIKQWAPQEEFVLLRHPKGGPFMRWQTYPEVQISALASLLPMLFAYCPKRPLLCGHEDKEKDKVDPGPALPWPELRAIL